MQEQDLKRAARQSGGEFFPVWDVNDLADRLPEGTSILLDQQQHIELWNRCEPLLLLAGALVGEWALRKRHRLV
jgi:hypothetical protein